MLKRIPFILLLIFVSACSNQEGILTGKDFDKGDWLFVNVDYAQETLQIIDDEKILKENKDALYVTSDGYCGGTTCDGFLKLYKDGKLIAQDEYLTHSTLHESISIKKSYKKAVNWTMQSNNETQFNKTWDSLKSANCYPTIYHMQPADKDAIWVYKIEE